MINSRIKILIKAIVFAVVIVLLVNAFVFTSYVVPFSTEADTSIYKNDRVLINKWSYGLRIPFTNVRLLEQRVDREDLIAFDSPNPIYDSKSNLRKGIFVDRCVGMPGDTLMLNDELIITNDKTVNPDYKRLYIYPQSKEDLLVKTLKELDLGDNRLAGYKDGQYVRAFSNYECYLIKQKLQNNYPLSPLYKNAENSHPFIVPGKGKSIKVTPWNMTLLCNTIANHENRVSSIIDDKLWVDGVPVDSFKFTQDYYWVVSNNPLNLYDSRLFGFIPQSHLVGRPLFVWFSSSPGHFFQRIE